MIEAISCPSSGTIGNHEESRWKLQIFLYSRPLQNNGSLFSNKEKKKYLVYKSLENVFEIKLTFFFSGKSSATGSKSANPQQATDNIPIKFVNSYSNSIKLQFLKIHLQFNSTPVIADFTSHNNGNIASCSK